jgi:hypothetical protein
MLVILSYPVLMKPLFVFILFIWLLNQFAEALESLQIKNVVFRANIKTTTAGISIGYLYALTDSALFLTSEKQSLRFNGNDIKTARMFTYTDLSKVSLTRKGHIWRSTLTGMALGAAMGILAATAEGNDSLKAFLSATEIQKELTQGISGALIGSFIGLITGLLVHKTFRIQGKKENYEIMRAQILSKLHVKN